MIERPFPRPSLAIEIKLSAAPRPSRGFWSGLADLQGARGFIVSPASERYPLGRDVEVLPASDLGSIDWQEE